MAWPWANPPTLTSDALHSVGGGAHMRTSTPRQRGPGPTRGEDCRVCLRAGVPGRAGRKVQAEQAAGETERGPGGGSLGPGGELAGSPPHQAARDFCPLAWATSPGSPQGLCGHLLGPPKGPSANLVSTLGHPGKQSSSQYGKSILWKPFNRMTLIDQFAENQFSKWSIYPNLRQMF